MFGENPNPPKPPKYEPILILLVAVGVSVVLTAIFIAVWYVSERAAQ